MPSCRPPCADSKGIRRMSQFRRPSRHRIHAFQPLARLHRLRTGVSALLLAAMALGAPSSLYAGDILRGGASAKNADRNAQARAHAGAEAAQAAKVRAQDRLARTTKAVNDMRALQAAARAATGANNIPNGLAEGGDIIVFIILVMRFFRRDFFRGRLSCSFSSFFCRSAFSWCTFFGLSHLNFKKVCGTTNLIVFVYCQAKLNNI